MEQARRAVIHQAMVKLAEGDRSAFPTLADALWPVILAFVRRNVHHEQDAEDVAQEVFLRICSRIAEFDCSRDGLSWAFGIASFEIMTHRRRKQRRRERFAHSLLEAHADPHASTESIALEREQAAALMQTLEELSVDDRVALGLGSAPSPDLSHAAMRKRRQRALEKARRLWRLLHGGP